MWRMGRLGSGRHSWCYLVCWSVGSRARCQRSGLLGRCKVFCAKWNGLDRCVMSPSQNIGNLVDICQWMCWIFCRGCKKCRPRSKMMNGKGASMTKWLESNTHELSPSLGRFDSQSEQVWVLMKGRGWLAEGWCRVVDKVRICVITQ